MNIRVILILILFIIMVSLMVKGKLTFVLSLPLLAFGIALFAGVPLFGESGMMAVVFEGGVVKMSSAYAALIISAWLGAMMNNTGVSKTIIKTTAELGGDKPLLVTVFLVIACTLIFTTISGLGGVIMVGSIAVPIMISVGVPGLVTVCVFLFSYAAGMILNLANWTYYSSLTDVPIGEVQIFAYISCGLTLIVCLAFILIQFKKEGVKIGWSKENPEPALEEDSDYKKAPLLSLITPLVPIALVMAFKWTIITALFAGIVYCTITVLIFSKGMTINKIIGIATKSAIDGVNDGALGILSMIVIGMLTASLAHPVVSGVISGTVINLVPTSKIGYILFFAVLAPLALYRGPLNIWGIGAGIATLITGAGILPATAVMCGFIACERMQMMCDPTNSHNVWLANFVGSDTISILKKMILYVWLICAILAVVSGFLWL